MLSARRLQKLLVQAHRQAILERADRAFREGRRDDCVSAIDELFALLDCEPVDDSAAEVDITAQVSA